MFDGYFKTSIASGNAFSSAAEDLAAVVLTSFDDPGDFQIVALENFAEKENGTFDGRKAFQNDGESGVESVCQIVIASGHALASSR